MQIAESVHIVELKLPFRETPVLNVYVIGNGAASTIIDTGMGDSTSNVHLLEEIQKLGISGKHKPLIINTHEHIEHFSGNHALQVSLGAQIAAHPIARGFIEEPGKQASDVSILGKLPRPAAEQLKRWSEFFKHIEPSQVSRTLNDRDTVEPIKGMTLRVIHTPGHARGHICLYDEERRTLFSGDQVIGTGTPYVGKWPYGSSGDMGEYIESLKRLRKLDMKLILPSHGPIVTEPYRRIDETIERKMKREEAIVEALEGGEKDILSLTKEVYGFSRDEDVYYYSSCVLAYLSKLKNEGKVDYSAEMFNIVARLRG